jgi:hypothetical protein
MHTLLERVHGAASTRRGQGQTVKQVSSKNRAKSSMELIAYAVVGVHLR